MMLHFEHWHCQFDKLSILSQLLLNLPTTYTHPLSLLQPLKFKCHQMGATHDVMSSGEQTCDVFSSRPVTFASAPSGKCPGASQKGNIMKEMGKVSCFSKQTFIFAKSSLGSSWLGSICNHTSPSLVRLPRTCLSSWAGELQLKLIPRRSCKSRGANGGSSWARRRSLPGPKLHPAARGYLEARTNNLGFSQYFAPDVVISPLWSLQNLASTSSSELKTSSQMIHHKDWKLSEEFCKTKRHVAISCCLVTFLKRQLQNWVWFRLSERSILSEQTEGVEGEREGKGRRLKRFQFQSVGKWKATTLTLVHQQQYVKYFLFIIIIIEFHSFL